MTVYFGITSYTANLFRGQNSEFRVMPKDAAGADNPAPAGTTGVLVITTSLTPDTNSVIATYNDVADDGAGNLYRVFADTDVAALPLGSFLSELRCTFPAEAEQIAAQGQINIYPTQFGP